MTGSNYRYSGPSPGVENAQDHPTIVTTRRALDVLSEAADAVHIDDRGLPVNVSSLVDAIDETIYILRQARSLLISLNAESGRADR